MLVYLKMKIKSLAAEAKIIRAEEKKYPGERPERYGLHEHRVVDVRREARAALLAYGFLRGRARHRIEQKPRTKPDWEKIERMAVKYAGKDVRLVKQQFAEWRDAA